MLTSFAGTRDCHVIQRKINSNSDTSCRFVNGNFPPFASRNDDGPLACLVKSIKNLISIERNQEIDLFEDVRNI